MNKLRFGSYVGLQAWFVVFALGLLMLAFAVLIVCGCIGIVASLVGELR